MGAGVIDLRRLDEHRVDVDADDRVPASVQLGADPPRSTPGVEHPRLPRQHRIDEPRFSGEIGAVGCHRPEPFDVPLRVSVVRVGHPAGRFGHDPSLRRRARRGSRAHSELRDADRLTGQERDESVAEAFGAERGAELIERQRPATSEHPDRLGPGCTFPSGSGRHGAVGSGRSPWLRSTGSRWCSPSVAPHPQIGTNATSTSPISAMAPNKPVSPAK